MPKKAQPHALHTRELYDRLVTAYRERPDNHAAVARQVDLDHRACKRAWDQGWPRYPWAGPIRDLVHQEIDHARAEVLARAARLRIEEAERAERARSQQVSTLADEEILMTQARNHVKAAWAISGQLARPMQQLARAVGDAIGAGSLQEMHIPADRALGMLGRFTAMIERIARVGEMVIQLERVRTGQANQVVELRPTMSPEEAAQVLEDNRHVMDLIRDELGPAPLGLSAPKDQA